MTQPIQTPEDFPVQWQDSADAHKFWTRERMHFPDQATALEGDVLNRMSTGRDRAFEHFGIPMAGAFSRINTYVYESMVPAVGPDEAAAKQAELEATINDAVASLPQQWSGDYLPEILADLAFWSDFDLVSASTSALLAHLEETVERFTGVWDLHFRTVIPMMLPIHLFDEMVGELFPSDDRFAAYRMLEGLPNKTTEGGLALWKLSRVASASADVTNALATENTPAVLAALAQTPDGRAFMAQLNDYLQEYGQRGDKWALHSTSWIEDPTPVLANLRDYTVQSDRDMVAEMEAAAIRREEAISVAREQLQGYPEPVVQQFEFLLRMAQEDTVLSEDHGFWIDFRCTYRLRMIVLEVGKRLADSGVIESADDVFHLTFEEILAGLAGKVSDYRSLVVDRKDEMARWADVEQPNVLGTLPPGPPPDDLMTRTLGKFYGTPVETSPEPGIVRGHAGSPGTATGRVRIIRSIGEADILEQGDILVAETTAPPWTPLFGTVAAVVTDTGGILSHCAVVAREYHIPAVVGTGIATTTLVDGQMVEVDGDAGIVRLLEP